MESGLKPGTGRGDSFTQAFPPILAFPDKFSGLCSSGIMFMSSVDTTCKGKEGKMRVPLGLPVPVHPEEPGRSTLVACR